MWRVSGWFRVCCFSLLGMEVLKPAQQGHKLTKTQLMLPSFFGNDFGSSFTFRGSVVIGIIYDTVERIGFFDGFS